MRASRKIRKQETPTFVFVVDGETEFWYIQMLKRNERHINLKVEPKIPNKKTVEAQYSQVVDLSKSEYSKVFWLVDLDTIIKESNEVPKGKNTPLSTFISLRKKLMQEHQNVEVIVNNPCLEFWFLLHFKNTSRFFDTCIKAETELKKYLNDYEKTQKYFTKQGNDIYLRLKQHLKTAILNADGLGSFDSDEQTKAVCEMSALFQTNELRVLIE